MVREHTLYEFSSLTFFEVYFVVQNKPFVFFSTLQLEVGIRGKGRGREGKGEEQVGSCGVIKEYNPPKTGVPGGNLVCFNPRGIRSKVVWEGQNCEGWREEEGPGGGVGGHYLATGVKGLGSPFWDPSSPSGLAGRGQTATPMGRSGAARYSRLGAGGGSQMLALQEDDDAVSQLLCQRSYFGECPIGD